MNVSTMLLESCQRKTHRNVVVHRPVVLCVELSPHVVWVSRSLRRRGADARRAITISHAEQLVMEGAFDGVVLNAPWYDCQHLIGMIQAVAHDGADQPVFALLGPDNGASRRSEMDRAVVLPQPINERDLWDSVHPLVAARQEQ